MGRLTSPGDSEEETFIMTTAAYDRGAGRERERIQTTGWAMFAAVTLVVLGALNAINGFTALQHKSYFTSQIVYHNLTFWGWAFLIWGVLEVVAGALVILHRVAGYYIGVSLAATAAILWFFMIFAEPWSALVGVLVSMLVIYSLTVASEDALN